MISFACSGEKNVEHRKQLWFGRVELFFRCTFKNSGGLLFVVDLACLNFGKLQFFSPFWEMWEIPLFPAPTFPTFPTIPFPTFGAAIIKSITVPAHVFLMETRPFKERTQPWSQPWVKRDLQQNLIHFTTFPLNFPLFPLT
jgi:hypothetical protein